MSILSVKDFGAKGDSTTNDYAAFKDALRAAERQSPTDVYVPAGRYLIEYTHQGHPETLKIPSGCHLIGDGIDATTIVFSWLDTDAGRPVSLASHDRALKVRDIGVKGISFQGYPDLNADLDVLWKKSTYGIQLSGHNVRVEDCAFKAFGSTFMLSMGGKDESGSWIRNNVYNSEESVSKLREHASKDCLVTRCHFSIAEVNSFGSFGIDGLVFTNNVVDYTKNGWFGILIDDASSHKLEEYAVNDNVVIVNNTFIGEWPRPPGAEAQEMTALCVVGTSSALIRGNNCTNGAIVYKSYDESQQYNKICVPVGGNCSLGHKEPFLHLAHRPRDRIRIENNSAAKIIICSGGHVDVIGNSLQGSPDDNHNYLPMIGIRPVTFGWLQYGTKEDKGTIGHTVRGNTLVANHENAHGICRKNFSDDFCIIRDNVFSTNPGKSFIYEINTSSCMDKF